MSIHEPQLAELVFQVVGCGGWCATLLFVAEPSWVALIADVVRHSSHHACCCYENDNLLMSHEQQSEGCVVLLAYN